MNRYLTELALKKRKWHIPVGILSIFLSVIAAEVWIEDSPADESLSGWLFAHICVMALMLWPLYHVVRWRLRQRSARVIARRLSAQKRDVIPLAQLDGVLGTKKAAAKIADLKKHGFLQRMEMDGENLILDVPVTVVMAAEAPSEDMDVLAQIRRLNDEIDDPAVSGRIDRLEQVTASILRTIEERPERADDARRFMNYYLPTTMKLLESYRLMEKQSYQGQNIRASRRQIEQVLEKLVEAAENQQDKLFRSEALDVEAEISVLETMMASDGLTRGGGMQ